MRSWRDVALVDLVEWTETLLVVGPADVEPVGGIGIGQDLGCHRDEAAGLRNGGRNRQTANTTVPSADAATSHRFFTFPPWVSDGRMPPLDAAPVKR